MEKIKPHVAKYKKKIVEKIVKLVKEYPIIGAVNLEDMPAPQLQSMRSKLRDKVVLFMTKKRLINIAIDECKNDKKGIEEIKKSLKGMPALLFTKENPFSLYKTISQNKSKAPAKAGQTAPNNIVIPAGPTPFAPGPVISELSMIGIKTGVENGKVAIKQDATVAKEGEIIKPKVAEILTRLGIKPMEVGLDLVSVYEEGVIYGKEILAIDEKAFMNNLMNAARWGINLAVEAGFPTKESTELMVTKAFREAKAVALEGNIMCDLIAEELVEKAERQMNALKTEAKITDAVQDNKKDEVKAENKETAEKPVEEIKKEEPVQEKKEEVKAEETKKEEKKPAVEEVKKETEETKKKSENIKTETTEELDKEKTEIIHEIKEIKKEIEEEKENPKIEEIEKIEDEIEKIEKEVESFDNAKERVITEEKKQMSDEGEKLFEQLKKQGTLRNIEKKEEKKTQEQLSPEEIIKKAQEKMKR